jgi:hypothetical protein
MTFFFLFQWVTETLPWLAPVIASTLTGGFAGYGSFRFGQGALLQRVQTVERDVAAAKAEHSEFVTRNEFELLREDLRDIKTDIREVRRRLN